jgi:copper chaperone
VSHTAACKVDGMTCDHCVRTVTGEISALPEVIGVSVDLGAGVVIVESAQLLRPADLRAAIEEAGCALR